MLEIRRCPECGVPEPLTQNHAWLNNGDIVHKLFPAARMGFIECENLDPLFANVGEIVGMPIEPLIVNIVARGSSAYLGPFFPAEIRESVRSMEIDPTVFIDPIMAYCHVLGYGSYEYLESRYERDRFDYSVFRILRPFSVPEAAGCLAGAVSAVVGGDHAVCYEEVSPGLYELTTSWTDYPSVLEEKMPLPPYRHREGDIDLERCPSCGGPRDLRSFRWHLEDGIITSQHTRRRMVVIGPELLDQLFQALAQELGEAIPGAVVEAQRRFARTGFYSVEEIGDEEYFRSQLALRGLGNLREMRIGARGARLRLDNASGYLLVVGMVQGLFETAFGVDSRAEWELSEAGDLRVEIVPRGLSSGGQ